MSFVTHHTSFYKSGTNKALEDAKGCPVLTTSKMLHSCLKIDKTNWYNVFVIIYVEILGIITWYIAYVITDYETGTWTFWPPRPILGKICHMVHTTLCDHSNMFNMYKQIILCQVGFISAQNSIIGR